VPLTFSMQGSNRFDARRPLFVAPESGSLDRAADDLLTTSSASDVTVSAAVVTRGTTVRATFSDNRLSANHAGIGGTNGPTTGQRIDSQNQRMVSTWRAEIGGAIHRGGLSFSNNRLSAFADSPAPSVVVTEQRVTGGDELAANARRSRAWLGKHVIERGKWSAGAEGRVDTVSDDRTPNPDGRIQFTAAGAATATWIVTRGRSLAASRISSLALFAERLMVNTPRATVRTGFRLDRQTRARAFVSPRIVAGVRFSGFHLTGGGGLFVQTWSPDLFVLAAQRDGAHGATFVVHDVPGGVIDGVDPESGDALRTIIARGFAPRRDFVARAGIQRRIGPLQAGAEHTWTRGQSLPGGARERDAGGLVDIVSSDRSLRRHQTHVRASLARGAGFFSAYYQHVSSVDNSDGPFGSPARRGDVDGEWGRSIGVARHAAGVTGSASLPGQVRLFVTFEARSGTAYSVVTGRDPDALGVFADRGGRPRNGSQLPPFRKLSLSFSRPVRIPTVSWLAFDVGVRADNVTDHLNVTNVGRVAGTPTFGRPLDASAGRSIRVWATLAR
jgi:hypothetical protein